MIVITGAAGFMGSSMALHLNESGHSDLILVDDFTREESLEAIEDIQYVNKVPRDLFFDWAEQNRQHISFLIHLDTSFHEDMLEFSQRMWSLAAMHRIPLLYLASSVEDYVSFSIQGSGTIEWGNVDNKCEEVRHKFDHWVTLQKMVPPLWAGFSMTEVYGAREYYGDNHVSSVMQVLRQIYQNGNVTIPCLPISEITIQEPLVDRIYVKDVVTILTWFMNHLPVSGFYRLATGYPRPLSVVAKTVFSVLNMEEKITYVPLSFIGKENYQNKNELPLGNLRAVGYKKNFTPLEKVVRFMVKQYLKKHPL